MRVLAIFGLLATIVGCGSSPVVGVAPLNIERLQSTGVDKIDILFAIDSSPSMGDMQSILAQSIPAFVNRLLNPRCVSTSLTCQAATDCTALGANAQCTQSGKCFVPGDGNNCTTVPGTAPELSAVHDMHIAIVSSSLGGGGSPDTCVVAGSDTSHQNDAAHLLNRTVASAGPPVIEGAVSNAKPLDGNGGNFLAWLPASNPKNAGKTPPNVTTYSDGQASQLVTDFQSLVIGVQDHGCDLEAQLESWYRFLVQPDPWSSIDLDSSSPPKAQLNGVDATLLKMRHDFLRPDSVVAIIQLTNKDDSWSDPLWEGGYGWTARTQNFPGGPGQGAGPIGTHECNDAVDTSTSPPTGGPNNPDCTSCAFPGSNKPDAGTPIGQDPNCQACAPGASVCPQKGWYTPAAPLVPITAADGLNARYASQLMRPKYGFDNQPNIQRYIDGLMLPLVPDRNNESHDSSKYAPTRNCVNPLFAETLPDGSDTSPSALCQLTPGSRTPDLIFYALIGGVPSQLISDSSGNYKEVLDDSDWTALVGQDPGHYVFTGMDPHMMQSTAPRSGLQAPSSTYSLGTDPMNGREWNTLTNGIDLEYACTFPLPAPRDCTAAVNASGCACTQADATAPDGAPLCDPTARTLQVRGKAYPSTRELRVAQALFGRSIVGSVCAEDTNPADGALPTYGYHAVLDGLVDRMLPSLAGTCLPQPLPLNADGTPACELLVEFFNQTNQAAGCTDPGMSQPTPDLLRSFDQNYIAALGDSGASVPLPVICVYHELVQGKDYQGASCDSSASSGWCYVTGGGAGGCAQTIKLGGTGLPLGATFELACTNAQSN